MAIHSITLAWKIPWTEEPGRLQPWGCEESDTTSDFTFTFHFHALEKEMATHSNVLAWRIPGTREPPGCQWAAVFGVAQSQTRLKRLSSSSSSSRGRNTFYAVFLILPTGRSLLKAAGESPLAFSLGMDLGRLQLRTGLTLYYDLYTRFVA